MTRPDIAQAVRSVARHSHNPCQRHWSAVMQILAYLKGTKTVGLTYNRDVVGRTPVAFADASFASDKDSRKSVSGGLVIYGGEAIQWYSPTQCCVATSSAEAAYMALSACSKELMFVKQVWCFLRPNGRIPPLNMFEDNESAILLAKHSLSSKRTKHIDVAYHYVRNLVEQGKVEVLHVMSTDQHADALTKALRRETFEDHRNYMLNREDEVHCRRHKCKEEPS